MGSAVFSSQYDIRFTSEPLTSHPAREVSHSPYRCSFPQNTTGVIDDLRSGVRADGLTGCMNEELGCRVNGVGCRL